MSSYTRFQSAEQIILHVKVCVPLCVLFSEIRIKWLHTVTEGDTQILTKANTCNKTGDLDITSDLPLTPETRVQVPVGPPDKFKWLDYCTDPFLTIRTWGILCTTRKTRSV